MDKVTNPSFENSQKGSLLVRKIAEVMLEVGPIKKNGHNDFHHYSYARDEDIAEAVRDSFASRMIVVFPDIIDITTREHINKKGYITTVKVNFTFFDGETGETLSIVGAGEGQDSGDKAVYKAVTGAQKYVLMKVLMLPTKDDPEADSSTDKNNSGKQTNSNQYSQQNYNQKNKDPRNQKNNKTQKPQRPNKPSNNGSKKLTQKQIDRLYAKARDAGITELDVKKVLLQDYKKANPMDLSITEYQDVCQRLDDKKSLNMPFRGMDYA